MVEPFQIEIGVPNRFRHQNYFSFTLFNALGSTHESLASELGLIFVKEKE